MPLGIFICSLEYVPFAGAIDQYKMDIMDFFFNVEFFIVVLGENFLFNCFVVVLFFCSAFQRENI